MAETEYIDHGSYYLVKYNGEFIICVACGKPREYSYETKGCCHKCSAKHDATKKAAATRNDNSQHVFRKIPYGQRLLTGFLMMAGKEARLDDR